MNNQEELYGEERLLKTCLRLQGEDMVALVGAIRADVFAFAKGEPQSDDVTMLALRLNDGGRQ